MFYSSNIYIFFFYYSKFIVQWTLTPVDIFDLKQSSIVYVIIILDNHIYKDHWLILIGNWKARQKEEKLSLSLCLISIKISGIQA